MSSVETTKIKIETPIKPTIITSNNKTSIKTSINNKQIACMLSVVFVCSASILKVFFKFFNIIPKPGINASLIMITAIVVLLIAGRLQYKSQTSCLLSCVQAGPQAAQSLSGPGFNVPALAKHATATVCTSYTADGVLAHVHTIGAPDCEAVLHLHC